MNVGIQRRNGYARYSETTGNVRTTVQRRLWCDSTGIGEASWWRRIRVWAVVVSTAGVYTEAHALLSQR